MSSKNRDFYLYDALRLAQTGLLVLVTISTLILSTGCAERVRKETGATGSTLEADTALAKAEKAMEEAPVRIGISFEELQGLETLSDLTTVLPNPLELGQLEDPIELGQMEKSLEDATSSMYDVLDALGVGVAGGPAAPVQAPEQIGSDTDLAMIHLHIAYLYIYDVIFRLVKVRKDPVTGELMYTISFPEEPDIGKIEEIYQVELTPEGQRRLDEAQGPEAFTEEQRQEVINTLYLLLGAKVQVTVAGVTQEHNIDTAIFRKNALYHFKEALKFAKKLSPEIEEGLKDLSKIISDEKNFAYRMLDKAEVEWGFEILNRGDVEKAINELAS